MRVEEYVGQRIRDRRDELGMTQEEFGRRLGHWLGKPWSRSTVSVAENGKRAFTAAELVFIANALDVRPAQLLAPPMDLSEVEAPSGATLSTRSIAHLSVGPTIVDKLLSEMYDRVVAVLRDAKVARDAR